MGSFFKELKRRQIFKAVIAYAVVAYLFAQIGLATFPVMRLPEWTVPALVVLLLLAFPVAMFMAWTKEDQERKEEVLGAKDRQSEEQV
jgi:adenylate cyclase